MPSHPTSDPQRSQLATSASLYFRKQGAGEPVILLHGLFGSMENLGVLARALAQNFCVYSLDLPNHGRSAHVPDMDLTSMATAISQWMDEHHLSRALLVGHSLGGKVLMELALMAPHKCQKLVVLDIAPVQYTARHHAVFAGLNAINPPQLASRAEANSLMHVHVQEAAVRSFLLKNLVKATAQTADNKGFEWRMNLPVIARCYPKLIAGNRLPVAPLEQPVLFIKGGNSDYLVEEQREAIVERFSNAKLRLVPNTGHWLHAEKPEHIAGLISRFLTV